MAEVQNSNPTILNVADLPTRTRSAVKAGDYHSGIFAAVPNPADFLSSDSEDDDLLEEPIDEQEIYGKTTIATSFFGTDLMNPFFRLDQVNLGSRASTVPGRTGRRLPSRYLYQANPPQRFRFPSSDHHCLDYPNYHPLQSSNGHWSRSPGALRTVPSAPLPG